jgi:hypothetical protein
VLWWGFIGIHSINPTGVIMIAPICRRDQCHPKSHSHWGNRALSVIAGLSDIVGG